MMILVWAPVLTALILQGVDCTSWPKGKYALLKPVTGCPEGWEGRGWLLQDTVHNAPSNTRSKSLHIDGLVASNNVIRSFCVKTTTVDQEPNWPQGSYCIYRKRGENNLTGMANGVIKMFDETTNNKDTAIYVSYKDWIYHSISDRYQHLVLYFQCQTSGNKKIPISLPITTPFYLLPYGSRDCQQVQWMVPTLEWIKYQTNNYINRPGQKNGKVPYHELGKNNRNKGTKMFYCYYESCNYTLTDKEGVFQSSGFPGQYPDGQLCSWRIMVPDGHTIVFNFTHFSLDDNDNVTLFRTGYSDNFQRYDTFQGHYNHSFVITASSNVQLVFQTNEEGNSTGFRAEYTVSKESETTPFPPSTTEHIAQHTTLNTGGLPGTTIPTTENKNKTNATLKKSRASACDGTNTTILIVIPLICMIVVFAVVIILYRWRSKKTKCENCTSTRSFKDVMNPTYEEDPKEATNPIYDDGGRIQINHVPNTSTATVRKTLNKDENDGKIHQQPEYQDPNYSEQNDAFDPNMDSGYPEYHEVGSVDNNVPDVVYGVIEGPDFGNGPSGDQMHQAQGKGTTENPLYDYTHSATMND